MKKIIMVLLFSFLLAGCAAEQETEYKESAVEEDELIQELSACVKIEAAGTCGSGVIYEESEKSLWIVTAAHVVNRVSNASDIQVSFSDETALCKEYYVYPEADVAFLRIEKKELSQDWEEKYAVVRKERAIFDAVESDTGVFLEDKYGENEFGFRFAMVKETWIYVDDFAQHMMLLSGEADAGMSGGGVFTEDGYFLGIICGANEEGELAILPYSIIESYLSKVYQSEY